MVSRVEIRVLRALASCCVTLLTPFCLPRPVPNAHSIYSNTRRPASLQTRALGSPKCPATDEISAVDLNHISASDAFNSSMTPEDKIEDKKLHRKLQNRANQRARRLRLREKNCDSKAVNQGSFEITRWRLMPGHSTSSHPPRVAIDSECDPNLAPNGTHIQLQGLLDVKDFDLVGANGLRAFTEPSYSEPSPRRDLLLSLIQYNVLRGVFNNKLVLLNFVAHFAADKLHLPIPKENYPTRAVILPTRREALPTSLLPTQLQMTAEHPTWIDSLPFPKMRDNLIKREAEYDHYEFAQDLVGNLMDMARFFKSQSLAWSKWVKDSTPLPGDDDLTTTRRGFIVWGEPHNPENWEVTPGFIHKWRWVMEGSENLIESTNRWRQTRGEEPLPSLR